MNTETMAKLADQTEDALVAIHNRLDAGEIVREEFIALATSLLLRAKARGVALADLALAAELSQIRRRVVTAIGLEVPDGAEMATAEAVEDTLASDAYAANAVAAVAVLGRAEALASLQEGYGPGDDPAGRPSVDQAAQRRGVRAVPGARRRRTSRVRADVSPQGLRVQPTTS